MPMQNPRENQRTASRATNGEAQKRPAAANTQTADAAQAKEPKRYPATGGASAREQAEKNEQTPHAQAAQSQSSQAQSAQAQTAPAQSEASVAPRASDAMEAPKRSFADWIRARWMLDEELPENEYYLRIAARYRLLKYAVIVLTLVLLLGMMAVYSEDITVENFRYLLRDLNSDSTKYTGIYETIHYDSGTDLSFALYKGDLVVVRPGQTSIYGMNAGTVMNEANSFYNPVLLSGEKYFLVYDPGQTSYSYSIYNAFSPLHTKRLEYPIYDGALSDEGTYAIVTEDAKYRGVVEIYDRDFELLTRVYKDKYIWDIALSPDASRLLVVSAYDLDGVWSSEVHLLDALTSETLMQLTLDDLLVYACHFTADGDIWLLTENDMRFYKSDSAVPEIASFDGDIPIGWSFGDVYSAALFNRTILGQDKIIRVMKDGETVGQYELEGQITQSVFYGKVLYVLTESALTRIDCETGEIATVSIEAGCSALLAVDDTHLMLCYGNRAVPVNPIEQFGLTDPNDTTEGETNVADT